MYYDRKVTSVVFFCFVFHTAELKWKMLSGWAEAVLLPSLDHSVAKQIFDPECVTPG